MRTLANIFWLGTKELRSFLRDFVLLGLVIYAFSLAIIAQAQSSSQEVHNASIAIVDEDHSELSRRIAHAFLPPYFQTPQPIAERDIVPLMNAGKYTFVIDIPPNFERDVLGGRQPAIQLNVDATAMVQAGLGAEYAQQIITTEIANFLSRAEGTPLSPVNLVVRIAFNPNVETLLVHQRHGHHQQHHDAGDHSRRRRRRSRARARHDGPSAGDAADARSRSRCPRSGRTVWSSSSRSACRFTSSCAGCSASRSPARFRCSCSASRSICFSPPRSEFSWAPSRARCPSSACSLLLVFLPMNMLSGSNTPLESMPPWLATMMQASPSTHFVSFAQAILYRGAGFAVVWPDFVIVALIGGLFLGLALLRFRKVTASALT